MDRVHCLRVTAGEKPCQSRWLTQCAVACRCSDQPVGLHACRQPSHDGDIADASHGPFVASSAPAAHAQWFDEPGKLPSVHRAACLDLKVCLCMSGCTVPGREKHVQCCVAKICAASAVLCICSWIAKPMNVLTWSATLWHSQLVVWETKEAELMLQLGENYLQVA